MSAGEDTTWSKHPQAEQTWSTAQDTGARFRWIVALECDRPLAGAVCHDLDAIDEVRIGRGPARTARRAVVAGRRLLDLEVPDRRISKAHARLVRAGQRWHLEDLDSKNGLIHNEVATRQGWLDDGDLIEIGHTFFRFRDDPAPAQAAPANTETAGLRTLVPDLALAFARLARVAQTPVPLLILGETGTGKEVVARAYHQLTGRPGALVAVNCGALPATLVESELFGHRRGAFSGAVDDRPGLVRNAEQGTLFLDEIGELPPSAQAALLRVLQEREVLPVGGARPIKVDFQLVSATHRDLDALAHEGRFRSDLLARLSGHTLRLPPLRERLDDLGLLVAELLPRLSGGAAAPLTFSPEAVRALFRYAWPRNIRELERCLGAAVALADGRIALDHLPESIRGAESAEARVNDVQPAVSGSPAPPPPDDAHDPAQRARVVALLQEHQGNVSHVAAALSTSRAQVHRLLKRFGLVPADFRGR